MCTHNDFFLRYVSCADRIIDKNNVSSGAKMIKYTKSIFETCKDAKNSATNELLKESSNIQKPYMPEDMRNWEDHVIE